MQDAYSISGWHPRRPDMPVLFISGEDDPCLIDHSRFDHAVRAMRRVGYSNIQSRLYPNMRHEILNEFGKKVVWNDILSFCSRIGDLLPTVAFPLTPVAGFCGERGMLT